MAALIHCPMTIDGLRREGLRIMSSAGISNARQEVVWLLECALETTGLRLQLEGSREVPAARLDRALAWFARRAQGEPLQYLLGAQEFCGLEFEVGPDVLIPRPETELLVQETARRLAASARPLIADVGTGSGCIAVALARTLPEALLYATDLSAPALTVAQRNVIRHGVEQRVTLLEGDLLRPLQDQPPSGRFAAVVSNPPYIRDGDLPGLQREVTREPRLALAGGPDGLVLYRRLLREAGALLRPHGLLMVEVGQGQSVDVCRIAAAQGWGAPLQIVRDAVGIERVLSFQKR